jgi:hypothetical protein
MTITRRVDELDLRIRNPDNGSFVRRVSPESGLRRLPRDVS